MKYFAPIESLDDILTAEFNGIRMKLGVLVQQPSISDKMSSFKNIQIQCWVDAKTVVVENKLIFSTVFTRASISALSALSTAAKCWTWAGERAHERPRDPSVVA